MSELTNAVHRARKRFKERRKRKPFLGQGRCLNCLLVNILSTYVVAGI